jgi:hypothetical protein
MLTQFRRGTFAQIAKVLNPDETRIDLIRLAVDREIARRLRQRRRAKLYVSEQDAEPGPRENDRDGS